MSEHDRAMDAVAAQMNQMLEQAARQEREKEFEELDRRALPKMSDKQLAQWQARYPQDSAQYILAEHEWQRRFTAEQVAATRFAAWIGILGVVIGGFFGWFLASWHPFH
jgi:hypothetical protein